jgi:S-adenosylmethionine:tRNA ribosyltransferase-isomerase
VTPATWPRDERESTRLLALDPSSGRWLDQRQGDLPRLLRPGDVVVVNDAATLPASLPARTSAGQPLELRLAATEGDEWWAVAFGEGDWRQRTEDRPPPPPLPAGESLEVGRALQARVRAVSPVSPRLLRLRFDADPETLWSALYRDGRPVQYSYMEAPLALWHVQTPYHSRPWAMEMPSAGRALTARLLEELRERGVAVAWLTHAAGLSSTGDAALDARLPLPERYEIPETTVRAVRAARAAGGRVVAVGTTVVRALESAAEGDALRAGPGTADLRLRAGDRRRVVDGILTGVHEPGTSHFDLLGTFAPRALLDAALRHAEGEGYLGHEFGDAMLILDGLGLGDAAAVAADPGPRR